MKTFYIEGVRASAPFNLALLADSISTAVQRVEDINFGLHLADAEGIAINRVSDKPSRRTEYRRID